MSTEKYTVKLSPSPKSGRDYCDYLLLILDWPSAQTVLAAVREGRGFTTPVIENTVYSFCADYFCWAEVAPYNAQENN